MIALQSSRRCHRNDPIFWLRRSSGRGCRDDGPGSRRCANRLGNATASEIHRVERQSRSFELRITAIRGEPRMRNPPSRRHCRTRAKRRTAPATRNGPTGRTPGGTRPAAARAGEPRRCRERPGARPTAWATGARWERSGPSWRPAPIATQGTSTEPLRLISPCARVTTTQPMRCATPEAHGDVDRRRDRRRESEAVPSSAVRQGQRTGLHGQARRPGIRTLRRLRTRTGQCAAR